MAVNTRTSRLSKILVETLELGFDDAEAKLQSLRLEIVVGPLSRSPSAQAAILTAIAVGLRTFVGGVRVSGDLDVPLSTTLPLQAPTLAKAAAALGATTFNEAPSQTIVFGTGDDDPLPGVIYPWWNGWKAGAAFDKRTHCDRDAYNPLTGIAAAALAVAVAFEAARRETVPRFEVDLWPVQDGEQPPAFDELFLPADLWLIGLGNLGQTYLWVLSSLPYRSPSDVSLVLQDRDKIGDENWSTSILVQDGDFGKLKTSVGERWGEAKGFNIRRIDRMIKPTDGLDDQDPRLALSGVDKIAVRRSLGGIGFDCIIDAGLGVSAAEFDRYRVNIFDGDRTPDRHFESLSDPVRPDQLPEDGSYAELAQQIGRCGAIEIAGASAAALFVSMLAATIAITRAIAVVSGCAIPASEAGWVLDRSKPRRGSTFKPRVRGVKHAGHPMTTAAQ